MAFWSAQVLIQQTLKILIYHYKRYDIKIWMRGWFFRSFIGFNAVIGSIHQGASFVEKHICLKKNRYWSKFLKVDKIKTLKDEMSLAYKSKGTVFYGPTKNELSYLGLEDQFMLLKE